MSMAIEKLQGDEVLGNIPNYSQVYLATHKGTDRRPFMERSFISFTYNGKPIEDFNLIATFSNNRLSKDGYASFKDLTTTYDVLDGQYYWNTHFDAGKLTFNLSTDGITQELLDEFLYWFSPGQTHELILSEHPNRGIQARVGQAPSLSLLPFEHQVSMSILGTNYTTSTTLYKGDITLQFVMDEPFWYAIQNILGEYDSDTEMFKDTWINPQGESEYIFSSKDALKVIYEDNVPVGSLISTNMILGDETYADTNNVITSRIWNESASTSVANIESLAGGGACINGTVNGVSYVGIIAGALIKIGDSSAISSLTNNDVSYFYYAGTAPAPMEISFTLTPEVNSSYNIVTPKNYKTSPHYETITIESVNKYNFDFTTPNIWTSYNKAEDIVVGNWDSSLSIEDIRVMIRDQVKHAAVRAWANFVLDQSKNIARADNKKHILRNRMLYFLKDMSGNICSASFVFNGKTGEATGKFRYRIPPTSGDYSNENNSNWATAGSIRAEDNPYIEDVGDMLRSNYLIIKDRNRPTTEWKIASWASAHKDYSHKLTHTLNVPLTNLKIKYQYLYL